MTTTILALILAVVAYFIGRGRKPKPEPPPYKPPIIKDDDDILDAWDGIENRLRGDDPVQ